MARWNVSINAIDASAGATPEATTEQISRAQEITDNARDMSEFIAAVTRDAAHASWGETLVHQIAAGIGVLTRGFGVRNRSLTGSRGTETDSCTSGPRCQTCRSPAVRSCRRSGSTAADGSRGPGRCGRSGRRCHTACCDRGRRGSSRSIPSGSLAWCMTVKRTWPASCRRRSGCWGRPPKHCEIGGSATSTRRRPTIQCACNVVVGAGGTTDTNGLLS